MKNEFNFNEVTDRIKKALKISKDYELAELLGMAPTTFNSRKKANSLPFNEILMLANTEKLDFNWLLTGNGTMYRDAAFQLDPQTEKVVRIMKQMDTAQKTTIEAAAENIERFNVMQRQLSELTTRLSA